MPPLLLNIALPSFLPPPKPIKTIVTMDSIIKNDSEDSREKLLKGAHLLLK